MITEGFSARGKVTLCGEHFVLHGAPALALPWDGGRLRLVPGPGGPPGAGAGFDPEAGGEGARLLAAWDAARQQAGLPPAGFFPFRVESTVPPGAGLGSSAALSVALVRAALAEAGRPAEDGALIRAATAVEALFHGRSSGLDPAAVVLGRPVLREPDGRLVPVAWGLGATPFVLALAPGSRRTAEAVARVRALAEGDPDRFGALRDQAAALVREAAACLAAGGGAAVRLGALMTRNHGLLAEAGVVTPRMDALVRAALEAGALGAKACGAGLGGVVLALPGEGRGAGVGAALQAAGALRTMPWEPPAGGFP